MGEIVVPVRIDPISCNMKAVFIALAICAIAAAAASDITPGEGEFIAADAADLGRPAPGCKLKCKPRSCSVTIYQHCNYHGYRINLKPGSYNIKQLQRKHMKNDDISSIRFHGRCSARLYEHWKFTGKTWNVNRNDSCFTNNHMKMSEFAMLQISDETTPETELTQAEWGRFRGRRRRISWNDQMSSMKVFNHAGRVCHYDCRARDAKERSTKKKEKNDKAHKKAVAEKKRKADMKKEKSTKAKAEKAKKFFAKIRAREQRTKKAIAAWRKRVAAHKKKRAEKRSKHEKKRKAAAKKRAAQRKKRAAKREKRMKAQFKKKKKKVAKCEVKAKGRHANRLKGMCRAYLRFCKLYKRYGLHDDAARHCKNAARMHKALVKHMKKHHKKHHKKKKMDQLAEFVQDLF